MNLLEHYIKKVISVKDVTQEWEKYMQEEEDPNFIETDPMLQISMIINCYGQTKETTKMCHKSEWDKIQEQGYYMA